MVAKTVVGGLASTSLLALIACSSQPSEQPPQASPFDGAAFTQSVAPKSPCENLYPKDQPAAGEAWERTERYLKEISRSTSTAFDFRPLNVVPEGAEAVRAVLYVKDTALWPDQLLIRQQPLALNEASHELLKQAALQPAPAFAAASQHVIGVAQKDVPAGYGLLDVCRAYGWDERHQLRAMWLVNFAKGVEGVSVWVADADPQVLNKISLHQFKR